MRKKSRNLSKRIAEGKVYVACPLCNEKILFISLKNHVTKFHPDTSYNEIKQQIISRFKTNSNKTQKEKTEQAKNKTHILDATSLIAPNKNLSIKNFAENYGWKGSADIVFDRLKSLGFPVMTQLDSITEQMKESFAKSLGHDNFLEIKELRSQEPSKSVTKLADIAQKLDVNQDILFNRLILEHAKFQCNRLNFPVRLGLLSSVCNLHVETIRLCLKNANKKIFLGASSIIEESDKENFLAGLSKLNFTVPRNLPAYLEAIAKLLIDENDKLKNDKFLKIAKSDNLYREDFDKKYRNLSLLELGKLYQSGKNDELDEIENDVIKGLINKKLVGRNT